MKPDYAVPPGAFVREFIDASITSENSLRETLGLDERGLAQLLDGELPIDQQLANKLEIATSTSAKGWLKLEDFYRSELERLGVENAASLANPLHETGVAKYLRDAGAITATRRQPEELTNQFLTFLGCADIAEFRSRTDELLRSGPQRVAALKVGAGYQLDDYRVMAWLQVGRQAFDQRAEQLGKYSEQILRSQIPIIRELCREPSDDLPLRIEQALQPAGVGFVFVPPPRSLSLFGMTRWLETGNPLIQLTGIYLDDGHFIHALFHELGHVLDHPNRDFYDTAKNQSSHEEKVANNFAYSTLLGCDGLNSLEGIKTRSDVLRKSDELGVSPGLIVMYQRRRKQIERNRLHDLFVKMPKPDIRGFLKS